MAKNTTYKVSNPLTLVGYEDDVDLRNISWNQELLEGEAEKYKLQHSQAIVYCNMAKSKVRLIAVFYGLAVLILPPIDLHDKISLYLKINQFLRRFKTNHSDIPGFIEQEINDAKERLNRATQRKAKAALIERVRKNS